MQAIISLPCIVCLYGAVAIAVAGGEDIAYPASGLQSDLATNFEINQRLIRSCVTTL